MPTSTSARNCFEGKLHHNEGGGRQKSPANAKSPRKQLKRRCFSRPAPIPDTLFFFLFTRRSFSSGPKQTQRFLSLTRFQKDLAIDAPEAAPR